jgi:hypothetical protein
MSSKLNDLIEVEGYEDAEDLMNEIMYDSVNPGICMNPGCDYTTTVEPDCHDGWCEFCETNTVKSATELLLF